MVVSFWLGYFSVLCQCKTDRFWNREQKRSDYDKYFVFDSPKNQFGHIQIYLFLSNDGNFINITLSAEGYTSTKFWTKLNGWKGLCLRDLNMFLLIKAIYDEYFLSSRGNPRWVLDRHSRLHYQLSTFSSSKPLFSFSNFAFNEIKVVTFHEIKYH